MPTADVPSHLVYVRQSWQSSWVQVPLMVCESIEDAAAPSHSTARLFWRYGPGLMPAIGNRPRDQTVFPFIRQQLRGWYVRIVINTANPITWTGILLDVADRQTGDWRSTVPTGTEHYTAFGLSILLDQSEPIRKTYFDQDRSIGIAVPFNAGLDGRRTRDRIATGNYHPTLQCFTDRTRYTSPQKWKAKDAFRYLIENFAPQDKTGTKKLPLSVSQASYACLDYDLPPTDYDDLTLWQALNRLVDRRRGLVMYTIINSSGHLEIVVDSSLPQQLQLPDNSIIPANRNKRSHSLSNFVNIQQIEVAAAEQTHQVIAWGEMAGVVMTVSPAESGGQLRPDWNETEEDTYNTAASDDANYSSLTDPEKAAANSDFRARDELAAVFSWWRLNTTWDLKGNNEGGTNWPAAFLINQATGAPDTDLTGECWVDALRFADFVPLRAGVDYQPTVTPETEGDDDQSRDYLAPMVWYQLDAVGSTSGDDGWVHCERINAAVDSGDTKREYQWSVQVQMRDDLPGLILQVVGGQQHFIAQDRYTSNGTFEDIPENEGVDLRNFLATVYLPLQFRSFAKYPPDDQISIGGDVKRVVSVSVPGCWLDWLTIGTVVGVSSGELIQSNGGWLRDDRERLESVAKLAWEFYAQPRSRLTLQIRAIADDFAIGQMITTLVRATETQTLNTVVTSISLNLTGNQLSVQTSFAELDLIGLTGEMSDAT